MSHSDCELGDEQVLSQPQVGYDHTIFCLSTRIQKQNQRVVHIVTDSFILITGVADTADES